MSNFSRGGAGGAKRSTSNPRPWAVNMTKVDQAPIEKVMAPGGSSLVPIRPNSNAERGGPVGGLQDADRAASRPALRNSGTARRGQDPNAARTMAAPTMAPPTPRPGQRGKAAPVPQAPRSLRNAPMATGPAGASGESTLRRMASTSRSGGALPLNGPASTTRMRSPSLPTPGPTFSSGAVERPGGSPTQQPSGGGTMYGVMQRGRGKRSSGSAKIQ